jgi:SAM-dependent methyltransferase
MAKPYDHRYFERWYRGDGGRGSPALLQRKVALAVAMAEYFLERPVRSALDVGCGEGVWRAALRKLRPKLEYAGLDASDYAVARHGRRRNLHRLAFGELGQWRQAAPVDLLVCSDVMHYLGTRELRRGLAEFSRLCHGLAFVEVYGSDDDIEGDLEGFQPRKALWYRRQLQDFGWVPCGMHGYLSPALLSRTARLEII